jgi:hypothetical protein
MISGGKAARARLLLCFILEISSPRMSRRFLPTKTIARATTVIEITQPMKIHSTLPSLKAVLYSGLLLGASLVCSATSSAKEFKLPNDEFAIASIDIPASWKPEAVDKGVEAQTEDASFYISIVAAGTDKGVTEDVEATKDMLKEHKVKIDESTQKTGEGNVNGFPTKSFTIKGKDEDGPCTVTILIVAIKDKAVVITYWFTDADLAKHEKEVDTIQKSLKAGS